MPITWKNISAPNFSDSNALRQQGLENIQGAFQGIKDMSREAETRSEDMWNRATKRQTDDYVNRLNLMESTDDVAALRDQITQDGYFDQYGGKIDQGAITDRLMARPDEIMTTDLNRMEHGDKLDQREWRDPLQQAAALALNGDVEGAEAAVQALVASGMPAHLAESVRKSNFDVSNTLFGQGIQRSNLAINQANASRQAQLHQRTMEGLDRAENSNERMMVLQDAALNYAGEYGDTEEGYQAFLAEIGGLEGLTATERLAAGNLWTKGVAAYNQVPEDVQRNMDDTYDTVLQGYQEQNKINFEEIDRSLEADAARFESETVRPYLTLYSEAGNQLGKIEARELIKESIDPGWLNFRSPGAVLSAVMEDIELNAREVANSIISDPRANPGLHELLANYGGRVPDSLIARAASSLKINKNGSLNTTTLKDNIRHELDTMISTMNAYNSYEQRRADRDRHKTLATQQAQDAADAVQGGFRLRTYNATQTNQ